MEQTHRIVHQINEAFKNKHHCSASFLGISQAFHKVWHTELLYKLTLSLPLNYFIILQNTHFLVQIEDEYTELFPIHAGVPQGSVLRPLLYLIFTADLPTSSETVTATFADDTAILAIDPPLEVNHNPIS
jgi:hypothetical protein